MQSRRNRAGELGIPGISDHISSHAQMRPRLEEVRGNRHGIETELPDRREQGSPIRLEMPTRRACRGPGQAGGDADQRGVDASEDLLDVLPDAALDQDHSGQARSRRLARTHVLRTVLAPAFHGQLEQ